MDRRKFLKHSMLGGILTLAGSYPILVERQIVNVNRYKIPIHNLPLSFHGFTIAQLTDLHLGFLVSPSFIEGLVIKANNLNTDMIVCTGDYVHERNTTEEIDQVWPILTKLKAKYGVYSVLGNHDHWADANKSIDWLQRSGQDIRHQCKPIYKNGDRIVIGGAGDYWEDELKVDDSFSCTDEKDCRILLSHNPDSVDTKFTTPISLVLSGHTHGGQVIIPFYGAPIVPVKNKRYTSGLIQTPKTQLFISRGIGWSILPIRFNCYPEIAVLELLNPTLLI
jgi:predicted MPP superfamily phosphohydrolase